MRHKLANTKSIKTKTSQHMKTVMLKRQSPPTNEQLTHNSSTDQPWPINDYNDTVATRDKQCMLHFKNPTKLYITRTFQMLFKTEHIGTANTNINH